MATYNPKSPRKKPSSPTSETPFFNKGSTPFFPLQPKLTIGKPGDKYEQEADRVADSVVNATGEQSIQRMGPEEEEMMQGKLQRMEEEELMQPQLQLMEEEEEAMQTKLQMQEEEEEEMLQPMLQLKEEGKASPAIENQLGQQGGGTKLPKDVNAEMSGAMGYDFSDVNIHTGGEAVQMNQDLNAQAFTHGNDVFFNQGKYNPDSREGKHLLAHELTHVVQQNPKGKKSRE